MTFEARKLKKKIFLNLLKPVVSATYSQLIIITTAVGNFPSKLQPNPPLVKYYGGGLRPGWLGKLLADWLSSVARKACNSPPKHPGEAFVVPL